MHLMAACIREAGVKQLYGSFTGRRLEFAGKIWYVLGEEYGEEIVTMSSDYITFTIGKKKDIALIAHDNEKPKLIEWCQEHYGVLKQHNLYGTGTTARMITDKTGLTVKGYNSGPLGGDQQSGAKIVEGVIDFVVFFSDPLTAQPHDPDVKALMRIAQVYDIPMAINKATADFMITSMFMDEEYEHDVINFRKSIKERAENM